MTYEEALAFWFGRIDYERRAPQPGDLKLDRMRALLRLLGDPHERLRLVHIAGTKGKGSTAAMLAQVLQTAGYRVGLFTSPHLSDVSERIQVDRQPISREEIVARITDIRSAVARMERSGAVPTFFEVGTALGFLHFLCRRVDVAVIEVGLGGRFDSTNVCSPMVSIITSISYDHMAQLGSTLSKIAFEKAGIIKPGRPVVSTALAPEARVVIERIASERGSRLLLLDRDFRVDWTPPNQATIATASGIYPTELGLIGRHQAENAAGVVAACELLGEQGFTIRDRQIAVGLRTTHWPGRLEMIQERPYVLLDCAHNVDSARVLMEALQTAWLTSGKRRLVFAISKDKEVSAILECLLPHFAVVYLTSYADNPRAVPPSTLAEMVRSLRSDVRIEVHARAGEALASACASAAPDDLIVVTGSVFLVGEVRAADASWRSWANASPSR